jgi:glycosyltransferase involved in cell wall biosynthesis
MVACWTDFDVVLYMTVTVITVARNAAGTIGEAVASVAAQRHKAIEHLLIDGASTDNTVEEARAASQRLTKIVSEPDAGIYDAMNKGLRLATGDVVGFLNADDLYAHAGVLARVAEVMAADPQIEACYSDLDYVDRSNPERVVRRWRSATFVPGLFARGWVPPHPTVYFRRAVLDRIGIFDTQYRLAADFEYLLRAFEIHRVCSRYVPEVWVKMRLGGATNKSVKNIFRGNHEIALALRTHRIGWPPFTQVCRMLRRVPQFFSRPR